MLGRPSFRVIVRVRVRITYKSVCLTASDDVGRSEEIGEAQFLLVRCRCHIRSVIPVHRQPGSGTQPWE